MPPPAIGRPWWRASCRSAARRSTAHRPAPPSDAAKRPPDDALEVAIVDKAQANPTDGYRMITAFVRRRLGRRVNRKRALRVMRERKLIQRCTHEPRRRRLGFFRVERPGQQGAGRGASAE